MNDSEWLKKHARPILEASELVQGIDPQIHNTFHDWTVYKLIVLLYFIDIYTSIIKNQPWVNKMRYIELFSGSGLCQIDDKGDVAAGSPILAASLAKKRFDEHILIEMDNVKCGALKKRMESVGAVFKVYPEDCNQAIPRIVDGFDDKDHYLAFVDCEKGMEVDWSTIEKLLERQGDLIFNFQTVNVHRSVAAHLSKPSWPTKSLDDFYGSPIWRGFDDQEDCLQGYINRIKEATSRKVVKHLKIRGRPGYFYDLIIATKPTSGRNPWINAIDGLQNRLDGFGPEFMQMAVEIIKGRQNTLDMFKGS